MKNRVIHTWNRGNSVSVRYKDSKNEIQTKQIPVAWYFAIRREDETKANEILNELGYRFRMEHDEAFPKYTKVFANNYYKENPQNKYDIVLALEDHKIETYEGDLPNDKRWYVDRKVEICGEYRKLYFDIETHDEIRKIEIGRDRIVSWAAVDQDGKVYFEVCKEDTDEAEIKMLKKFLKVIREYDILIGWNSKGFDVPYLRERMRKYNLHQEEIYCWKELAHSDLLKRFRHMFRVDNHIKKFSLEYISQHFLGKGKIQHGDPIHVMWKTDRDLLKKYNIEDCNLLKELDEKLGVSNMMVLQSQWCGVPPAQFGLYAIIDSYIMKTAHDIGEFCKTSVRAIKEKKKDNQKGSENPGDFRKKEAKYTGAAVIDPVIGMYQKVYTFDFKSLYPSMMRTSNIGFDSIQFEDDGSNIINPGTKDIKRKSGWVLPTFFSQELSVINLAITELLKKRKEYKKLKLQMIEDGTNKGPLWERVVSDEIIVKELANSTYGIMGLEYGRYYSVDIAESITLFGQWIINFAKKFFESRGYKVIYGDTDSVFVATEGQEFDQDKELEVFHEDIKNTLRDDYRISDCYIELEPDKIYEKLILIAKKTYVGHVTNIEGKKTNDVYARGLDFIKKNTFGYAATKQKELIELILRQGGTEADVDKFLEDTKNEFYSRDFEPKELAITQKVGKPTNEYKTPPLHVRLAAEIEAETGENLIKTEIDYIVTKHIKGLDGVTLEKFTGEYDKDYYWEKKTQPILERVSKVAYPKPEPVEEEHPTLFVLEKGITTKVRKKSGPRKKKVVELETLPSEQLELF